LRVFVTGAASPLGRTLIDRLTLRGDDIIGQVRRRGGVTALERIRVQPLRADLADPRKLVEGMSGCDVVFHLARFFDFWSPDNAYERVNCTGTRHVMAAAIAAGVRRVVLCSSAITIGEEPGSQGHEFTRHRGRTFTALERSFLSAEQLALSCRSKGIEVVVVNPGLMIAPNDMGWTGRLLARHLSGESWFASDVPVGWVSVHDVAKGMMLAAERGEDGGRYILSGASMSPRELLTIASRLAKRTPPMPLPSIVAHSGAAISTILAAGSRTRPRLSRDEARFGAIGFNVDGSHARESLELEYTPVARYLPGVVESYRMALERF
jgi:dihydroflavonol-4-reductase